MNRLAFDVKELLFTQLNGETLALGSVDKEWRFLHDDFVKRWCLTQKGEYLKAMRIRTVSRKAMLRMYIRFHQEIESIPRYQEYKCARCKQTVFQLGCCFRCEKRLSTYQFCTQALLPPVLVASGILVIQFLRRVKG
jgi:hypothetical protein